MVGSGTKHWFTTQGDVFMCPGHSNQSIMMIFEIPPPILVFVRIVLRTVLKGRVQ